MRVISRSVLACSLAFALGLPGSALAAAPSKSKSSKPTTAAKGEETVKDPGDPSVPPVTHDGAPRIGRVWVDAEGIGAGGPVVAGRAMRAGRGGLESQAVTITDAPAGPELRVKLSERDAGGYRVEYEIIYDGKTIKNGTGGFDCQLCTEDELIEKVEALAVQVAPKMVVPQAEADPGPGPGPGPGPDEKDPDEKDPDEIGGSDPIVDENPNALGTKGKAGIGLLVVGGLGVLTGVVLVVLPPLEEFPTGHENAAYIKSTRPPGWGVLGGGVAAAVVGAVLLGLDRKQAKRRAAGKTEARVHPWFGPNGAGVGVVGRF